MTRRIFQAILGTCLLVLGVTVFMTVFTVYRGFVDEEVARLDQQASSLATVLNRSQNLEQQLDIVKEDADITAPGGIRVCLFDPDGRVIFDSFSSAPANEGSHADRQEIMEARENGKGFAIRHSQTLSTETYNWAIRLRDGSFLRLSQSHSSLLALFGRMIMPALLFLPVLIGACYVMARLLSRHIVEPINAINPAHPLESIPYEQLRPLLERLDENNRQIQTQMEELERSRMEFETLSASMDEGLVMVMENGKPAFVNQAARQIFGLHDEKDVTENADLSSQIDQALKGKNGVRILNQSSRTYSVEAQPVRKDGTIIGAIVLALDITEKREARRRRQEFTANVTHELKTPLQTISSSAELLSSGMVKEEDQPRFIGYIQKEARRMSEMISDIIHLSRLENEESQTRTVCDLYAAACSIAEKLTGAAASRQIDLSCEGTSVMVCASPADLDAILKNLMENAIRYNRPGGFVRVLVRKHKNMAQLIVEDNGIGIEPELQERVFERFFTVDPSRSQSGTGLGLAIVWHAVEKLGGTIDLSSAPGKGTRFTVKLPLAAPSKPAASDNE